MYTAKELLFFIHPEYYSFVYRQEIIYLHTSTALSFLYMLDIMTVRTVRTLLIYIHLSHYLFLYAKGIISFYTDYYYFYTTRVLLILYI